MDPLQDAKRLSRDAESELSAAAEDFVSRPRFADTLALAAENIAATTKIAGDAFDLALRNLRVAGRRDLVILANQLGRTEDKLERVLQEIELLRDEVMARSTPEPEKPANSEGSKAGAGKRRAAPKRKTANSNRLTANE